MAMPDGSYVIDGGVLRGYRGDEEIVVIPEDVWSIGECAFRGNDRMRRIELNNVKHIGPEAFKSCSSLESIVISSYLEDIDDCAFKGCRSLSSVVFEPVEVEGAIQPEGLDIGIEAFADCTGLERVDLSLVDKELSVDFDAFARCASLASVAFPNTLTFMGGDVFWGCKQLEQVSLPELPLDCTEEEEGAHEVALRALKDSCPQLEILVMRPEFEPVQGDGEGASSGTSHAYRSNIRRLAYSDLPSRWAHKEAKCLFKGFTKLEELDLEGFETWGEESFACMFKGCAELREINLWALHNPDVRDLRQMFFGCRNLRSLAFSSLDTSQVEDMAHLLHNCHALERVDLSGLDLSRVRSLWSAFDGCESLKELDFSEASMPALEKVGYLFRDCMSLESVDLHGFGFSNVESLSHMFYGCSSLRALDLSSHDLSQVKTLRNLAHGCASLESFSLAGARLPQAERMDGMLARCSSLITADFTDVDLRGIRTMEGAFAGCSSLVSLDLSCVGGAKVNTMAHAFEGCSSLASLVMPSVPFTYKRNSGMFEDYICLAHAFDGCSSLTSLDLSFLKDATVETMDHCFSGCSSLQSLILPDVVMAWNFKDPEGLFDGCTALKHWSAPASWPLRPATIPKPTSPNGAWWSLRDKRWLTVEEISQRGRVADAYYAEETGALSSVNGEDATNHPILSRREREGRG